MVVIQVRKEFDASIELMHITATKRQVKKHLTNRKKTTARDIASTRALSRSHRINSLEVKYVSDWHLSINSQW